MAWRDPYQSDNSVIELIANGDVQIQTHHVRNHLRFVSRWFAMRSGNGIDDFSRDGVGSRVLTAGLSREGRTVFEFDTRSGDGLRCVRESYKHVHG